MAGQKHPTDIELMAFAPLLERALGAGSGRRTASIVCGEIYRAQWDRGSALRTVIVVALQRHEGNARLRTALWATYKCFTACHNRISLLLRARFGPKRIFFRDTFTEYSIFPSCVRNNRLDFKTLWYDFLIESAKIAGRFRRGVLIYEKAGGSR